MEPARPSERLIVGAMSGTSADGVDVALAAVSGSGSAMSARVLRHHHAAYDDSLRHAILSMRLGGATGLAELARVTRDVSVVYGNAVRDLLAAHRTPPEHIAAVACHGQTLYHAPPCTMQVLDPALVAAATGCTVVSDFRRADCAAGGQGAPLVPFADALLFRHPDKPRVLLNIGGIANVTYVPAGRPGDPLDGVVAFDTGPGNCVSDHLMRLYDPDGAGVDLGGRIAANGQPIYPLMHQMLAEPYFAAAPPKSTDGPAMIDIFARAYETIDRKFPFENLMRTACLLTAITIADAIRRFDPFPAELVVSGGGMRNETMMTLLRQPLGELPVICSDELGVAAEAKEALAFALLGAATLDGQPSNIPAATGASRAVVLGSITPPPDRPVSASEPPVHRAATRLHRPQSEAPPLQAEAMAVER